MGRKGKHSAGRDRVLAIPLFIALAWVVAMAATGYALHESREASPVLRGQAALPAVQGVVGQASLPGGGAPDANPASAVPSTPLKSQPSQATDNLTGAAGGGALRASFTVVSP